MGKKTGNEAPTDRLDKKTIANFDKMLDMTEEEYQEFIRPASSKDIGFDEFLIPKDTKIAFPIIGGGPKDKETIEFFDKMLNMTEAEYQEAIKPSLSKDRGFDEFLIPKDAKIAFPIIGEGPKDEKSMSSKNDEKRQQPPKKEEELADITKEMKKIGIKRGVGPYAKETTAPRKKDAKTGVENSADVKLTH